MSEKPGGGKTVWKRITQSLATVLTITFPFLVILLLPIGKVVAKLEVVLDRLGAYAIPIFMAVYIRSCWARRGCSRSPRASRSVSSAEG